jgi:nicotinamidase/pyrazinamidase
MKPTRRALIVVDMQNSFVDPKGSLYVKGAETLVPAINKEVLAAAVKGDVIVFTKDWHPKNHCSFVTEGGPWPVHCVENTPGAELHKDMVTARATTLNKGTSVEVDSYSGFYDNAKNKSTGLTNFLRSEGVETVDVCGVALDYCVKFTALDAAADGFKARVLHHLTKAVNIDPKDEAKAIAELKKAGVTVIEAPELTR